MFFNFNFHRCKPVTGEDFILKLIPSVFTEFSRKFLLRHHMFHRNNGKITDIGSMFASGLLRPCFWNFITVCSALRKRFTASVSLKYTMLPSTSIKQIWFSVSSFSEDRP